MSKPCETRCWNPHLTLELLGGDRDLFVEMIHIFLEEAPKQVQALRKFIDTKDASNVEHAAHRLKGDLSYLNARNAAEYARTLEDAGHNGDLTQAGATVAALEAELEVIFDAMRAVCVHRNSTERA